jgi:hypothetical protein
MTELRDKGETPFCSQRNVVQEYHYYCKLLDDMTTRTPCLLTRQDLKGMKDFACGGCSKDTLMNSRHNRLSALRKRS